MPTGIEWTDETWNMLRARFTNLLTGEVRIGWHCEHASEGCRFCYAEQINKGFFNLGTKQPYTRPAREKVEIFLDQDTLRQPLHWRKPRRVFVCSMTDLFGEWHTDEMIDQVFAMMALAPQHTFQVLTKRAQRMRDYINDIANRPMIGLAEDIAAHAGYHAAQAGIPRSFSDEFARRLDPDNGGWPLLNVQLGVSAENQEWFDKRVNDLWLIKQRFQNVITFVSCEPLLGPIDARWALESIELQDRAIEDGGAIYSEPIDWIIVGGESGPHARPMHPEWARSLRDQCQAANVNYFFKQWGEWMPISQFGNGDGPGCSDHYKDKKSCVLQLDGRIEFAFPPGAMTMLKIGKHESGRLLDGREHNDMPEVTR